MVINFKKLLNLEKQLVDCAKLKYEPIESLGFLASFKDPPKKLNRFVQGKYAKMNIFFRISSKKWLLKLFLDLKFARSKEIQKQSLDTLKSLARDL